MKNGYNNEFSDDEHFVLENNIENNNKNTPKMYRCKSCSKILLNYLNIENHNLEIFSFCIICNKKWKNNFNSFENFLYALDSVKCGKCKKETKRENDRYYYCYECKNFFCLSCKRKHNKDENHNDFSNIEQFDSTCDKHFYSYTGFCENCNSNICLECEFEDHNNHQIESLSKWFINEEKIENYKKILDDYKNFIKDLEILKKKIINNLNKRIDELKQKVDNIIKSFDIFNKNSYNILNINEYILQFSNFAANKQDMCFQQLKTVKNFFNFSRINNIKESIKNIKEEENLIKQSDEFINFIKNNDNYWFKSSENIQNIKKKFLENIIS